MQGDASRTSRLPYVALELLAAALHAVRDAVVVGGVEAFAVDAHGRRDDELADRLRHQRLEQNRGPQHVDLLIGGHLVHRLADADARGEVHEVPRHVGPSEPGPPVTSTCSLTRASSLYQ